MSAEPLRSVGGGLGRPRARWRPPRRILVALALAAVVALHVLAWIKTEFSIGALVDGYGGMADFVGEAVPPDLSWSEVLKPAIDAALVTLYIAVLGTTFALPGSVLLAVLGARNTTPGPVVHQAARSVMSFLRAVPDVVFALIFVTAVGLGPFPGVLALILHTMGVLGKLFSEAIEEIDPGPSDALRVAGARPVQVVAHAVTPSLMPTFVGLTLYRFDVNVRSSLVLGLVGAGGIGFLINESIKLFRFDRMLTDILVVLVLVVVVDNASSAIRKRMA